MPFSHAWVTVPLVPKKSARVCTARGDPAEAHDGRTPRQRTCRAPEPSSHRRIRGRELRHARTPARSIRATANRACGDEDPTKSTTGTSNRAGTHR